MSRLDALTRPFNASWDKNRDALAQKRSPGATGEIAKLADPLLWGVD